MQGETARMTPTQRSLILGVIIQMQQAVGGADVPDLSMIPAMQASVYRNWIADLERAMT